MLIVPLRVLSHVVCCCFGGCLDLVWIVVLLCASMVVLFVLFSMFVYGFVPLIVFVCSCVCCMVMLLFTLVHLIVSFVFVFVHIAVFGRLMFVICAYTVV